MKQKKNITTKTEKAKDHLYTGGAVGLKRKGGITLCHEKRTIIERRATV